MNDYLGYLILGTGAGAIIAATALGLLITQQGAAMVNLSLGAMMTWTVHVYADLRDGAYPFPFPGLPARYHFSDDVGLIWALLLSLLTTAVLALVVYRLVFRPLYRAPSLSTVVAHVGVIIVITSLVDQRFDGSAGIRVDPIFPNSSVNVIGDTSVPQDGLWLAGFVVVLAVGFWLVSQRTKLGLLARAAASNEKGVELLGHSSRRLAERSYIVATVVCGLVAILAAPMLQILGSTFTLAFLIPALGAALVGRFSRIGTAIAVGFAIAMVQSTFTKMQIDFSWWPKYGTREGLPFLVIIVAMWFIGDKLPKRGSTETWRLPAVPPAIVTPWNVLIPIAVAISGLLWLGPLWRAAIMTSAIAAVFCLSFVVITGLGGQTTLAQMPIAGIAGFTLSKFATQAGIPFPIAPLLAATVAMAFGVLVGLPGLRVRGTNLAIVTLGGAVAITEFLFKNPAFVGDASTGGASVPNPSVFGWDFGLVLGRESSRPIYGIFLVAVVTVLALFVASLRQSSLGRRMLAMRGNERAARASGMNVTAVKLQAYAISSFIAGIGGCLIAYRFGRVSDSSFGTFASLAAIAVAYIGGVTSVSGAITAGALAASGVMFFGMTEIIGGLGPWQTLIGGVLLVITAVANPDGVAGGFRRKTRPPKPDPQPGATRDSGAAPATAALV
jgi:branched-chain amino acid transport system permease protein